MPPVGLTALHQRQADIEQTFRERREVRDRELEEKRWDLITRSL